MAQMVKRDTGSYLRICPDDPHYLEYGSPNGGWHKSGSFLGFGDCHDLMTTDGGKTIEAQTSTGVFIKIGNSDWTKKR